MSELLNSGRIAVNLKKQRQAIIDSWNSSGLLDGLKGGVKENIAQLYESEASVLLNDVHHSSLIEYYEEKCHKNITMGNFREAAYYNRKMIYSIEDKILKDHCAT
jgi:hypothetical protein